MKTRNNNNFSQKYINNIKTLFPVIRKKEKIYLRQMKQNIDDYCTGTIVSSLEELYQEFGEPQDVVHSYYSMTNMLPLFTYIRLRRIIKYLLTFICVIIFAVTIYICTILYKEHLVFMRQEAIFIETTMSDSEEVSP